MAGSWELLAGMGNEEGRGVGGERDILEEGGKREVEFGDLVWEELMPTGVSALGVQEAGLLGIQTAKEEESGAVIPVCYVNVERKNYEPNRKVFFPYTKLERGLAEKILVA